MSLFQGRSLCPVILHCFGPRCCMWSAREGLLALANNPVKIVGRFEVGFTLPCLWIFCSRLSWKPCTISSGCCMPRPPISMPAEILLFATRCRFCFVLPSTCLVQRKRKISENKGSVCLVRNYFCCTVSVTEQVLSPYKSIVNVPCKLWDVFLYCRDTVHIPMLIGGRLTR